MMICLNKLNEQEKVSLDTYKKFLLILYPFAPKMTLELLRSLNSDSELKFPNYDESFLVEKNFDYPIAINGKVRGKMGFDVEEEEEKIKQEVLQSALMAKYVGDKNVKKIFVIKNKMINIVI